MSSEAGQDAPEGPGSDAASGAASDAAAWPPAVELDLTDPDPEATARRDLEAILFVADEPVTVATLARVLELRPSQVERFLVELAADYAEGGRGFVLRAVAGGWRLYTHPGARSRVDAYLRAGAAARLSQAALETLAVIAYRQPVARQHVAAVRGVNVDGVLRTLLNRGLVQETGRDEGPGQAVLYGTTPRFLEQLGLRTVDDLPPVADYLPEGVDLSSLEEQW